MNRGHDIKIKFVIILAMMGCAVIVVSISSTSSVAVTAEIPLSANSPADTLEGCLKCHDKIEPMHRFGPTATLDKLDHGKDALGLTCTACHGGNPAATEKEAAH